MKKQIENPVLLKSGFIFNEVLSLYVNFHRLPPFRGDSYIPLPDFIQCKKVVINPKNEDKECFKWVVIASLHNSEIKSHPNMISNLKKFEANYDWSNLSFPTSLKEIKKFELINGM